MADLMAEQRPMTAEAREAAIIAAYQAGVKVTVIERDFDVARSTLYHILKRSGVKPARTTRSIESGTRDSILAGLHELVRHQDRLLAEKDAEIDRLRGMLDGAASRPRRRRSTAS